jgi:NusA-like KH domain protein
MVEMTVKLETDTIRIIAAFEKLTKVHAKDCLVAENCIYFLVDADKIGMAIGKNGAVIKETSNRLGKRIRLFGHADTPEGFIRGMVPGLKDIRTEDSSMVATIQPKDRTMMIGKNGETIKAIRDMLKRHYSISDFKIKM